MAKKVIRIIPLQLRRIVFLLSLILYSLNTYSQWEEIGTNDSFAPLNGAILDMCSDQKGNIYAVGSFTTKDTSFRIYVAKWNGVSWSELGKFNNLTNAIRIERICSDQEGNIYAAVAGLDSAYVAKWDGVSWQKLGNLGIKQAFIFDICADLFGNVYVATSFPISNKPDYIYTIKKWNGAAWSEIIDRANSFANSDIICIDVDSNGNVYAGGGFYKSNWERYVVRWNGVSWKEIGEGVNRLNANLGINDIQVLSKDEVYATGTFTDSIGKYYIAKWDGQRWSQVGPGSQLYGAASNDISFYVDKNHSIYTTGFYHDKPEKRVVKLESIDWVDLGHGYHKIKNMAYFNSMLIDDSSKYMYLSASYLFTLTPGIVYRYPICNSQTRVDKSICLSDLPFTWFDKVFSENHLTDTLVRKNSRGCDSLVLLKLNIVNYSDSTLIRKGDTLYAPKGDSYQWIDCNLKVNINGETGQKFVIKKSGKYAVRVGVNNCSMTTKCSTITLKPSLILSQENDNFDIYQNPLTGILFININDVDKELYSKVSLMNTLGQLMPANIKSTKEGYQIDMGTLSLGIYFLNIQVHSKIILRHKVLVY